MAQRWWLEATRAMLCSTLEEALEALGPSNANKQPLQQTAISMVALFDY